MRVVIDTNVLLQAIPRTGKFSVLLDAFIDGAFLWVMTTEIHLEYVELLERRGSRNSAYYWENILANSPDFIAPEVYYRFNTIISDPDDNKFIDAYIAAEADYLVTEDRHFNILKDIGFPAVNIILPQDFIALLTK